MNGEPLDDFEGLGFETGFCQFCRYETETKDYGHYWLCEVCSQLSKNDMKIPLSRHLSWGINHILAQIKKENLS